jgi:hypothetical protein
MICASAAHAAGMTRKVTATRVESNIPYRKRILGSFS